jgi:hypothetical protein
LSTRGLTFCFVLGGLSQFHFHKKKKKKKKRRRKNKKLITKNKLFSVMSLKKRNLVGYTDREWKFLVDRWNPDRRVVPQEVEWSTNHQLIVGQLEDS